MPKTSLVLTILGPDRPGLVEFLASVVAEHDANWLESRMTHLAGHFAGLLRVEVDADRASALTQAIQQASTGKLDTIVYPDNTQITPAETPPLVLDVVGHDRPGIVREITRVLAAAGANLEDLSTETRGAPHTGQPVFHATTKIHLPADADEAAIRSSLEAVATDLMVEVNLAPGEHDSEAAGKESSGRVV